MNIRNHIFNSWLINKPIAHRGLHGKNIPENSLLAFEKAISKGYSIEFDVQSGKNGVPIVFHDRNLHRMTGKNIEISNLGKNELKKYKLKKSNERIHTLERVLEVINGRVPVIIEIKTNKKPGLFEQKIANLLRNYKGDFAISSFNPYTLAWFRIFYPDFIRGQNSSFFRKDKKLVSLYQDNLQKLKFNNISKPHFIAYDINEIPNKWLSKYSYLPIIGWTVKTQEQYSRAKLFVDNIIFENIKP
ncbi:MAG: glycerophosphodiester phosphodiesterase family protein [bacterium]